MTSPAILNKSVPISVLLIDDQPIIAEAIKGMIGDQPDIILHYCKDASKAIKMALDVHPSVILMDLVMPNIEGMALVSTFRANHSTKEIPLIVLSAKEDPIVKADAFRMGANDYMVKLPNRIELIARIRYHSEAYTRLLERNAAYKKLEESQKALNAELAEAGSYVLSLLPKPITTGEIQTTWQFLPSTQLGGDAFGYHWIDKDCFAFYLLDVCGHGVGAALLSLSVMNMLNTFALQTVKYSDPVQVLRELNTSFPMEKNNNMFFSIWYGVYRQSTRTITYACAGHPPAVLVYPPKAGGAKEVIELRTDGSVIGVTPNVNFQSATYQIKRRCHLYLFSDGIYELTRADGTVLPLEEFIPVFGLPSVTNRKEIDRILDYVKSLGKTDPFVDDVSLLEIVFEPISHSF